MQFSPEVHGVVTLSYKYDIAFKDVSPNGFQVSGSVAIANDCQCDFCN